MIHTTEQIKGENLIELGRRIYSFSPPLYINTRGLELIASSILLKWKEKRFLVTAGHVLNNYEDKIGLFTKKRFLELAGPNVKSKSSTNSADKIDIGAYALNDSFMSQLDPSYAFFDLSTFNFDSNDSTEDEYMVVGHPIRNVRVKKRLRKIVLNPFLFQSKLTADKSVFKNTKTKSNANFLLNYRRRKIRNLLTNTIVQGPVPEGLSGAGVWRFSNPITANVDAITYFPTGIIIEYYHKYSTLIGTRINIITELLRQNFDASIPKSKTVLVNTFLTT